MDLDDAARIIAQAQTQRRKFSDLSGLMLLREALSMFEIKLNEFLRFRWEAKKAESNKKDPPFVISTPTGGKPDWRLKKKRR